MDAPEYLVSIAVGPVQEFIASGRKLRDLWYGSDLLSELSKSVVRSLSSQGCELIFPVVSDPEDIRPHSELIVANKILAKAPSAANPQAIITQAKHDFLHYWQDLCDRILNRLPTDAVDRDRYHAQVRDFGEFYGVWTTISESYPASRLLAEQLLAGRKTLREFHAPTWDGAGLLKSSLDGIRENVVTRPKALEGQFLLKKGEQLDALGIVKRKGVHEKTRGRPMFNTLSEVAVQPYLAGLANDEQAQRIFRITDLTSFLTGHGIELPAETAGRPFLPKGFPAEWLIPACLAEVEREYGVQDDPVWQRLTKEINTLHQYAGQPHPYACLLVGDGDHMGKTLNALDTVADHQRFSTALNSFARAMHTLVPEFGGGLIYSGGDDVMAYLPLHTGLQCACAIQQRFAEAMVEACRETAITRPPTFSVGLAIVHHHLPLHSTLDLARRAEQVAKIQGGRNSLAIIQAKRSGSVQCIHGKWEALDELAPFQVRMQTMVDLHGRGAIPSRLGHQLRRIALQAGDSLEWRIVDDKPLPANAGAAEALRMITRKRQKSGDMVTEADLCTLLAGRQHLRQLADELVIANQFAAANSHAQAEWRTKEDDQ